MLSLATKRLAENTSLMGRLGQEVAPVIAAIDINSSGVVTLQSLLQLTTGKVKKLIPTQMWVPQRSGRTGAVLPEFIVDKAEYVLGLGVQKKSGKTQGATYRESIDLLASATKDEGVIAFAKFLNNEAAVERIRQQVQEQLDDAMGNFLIRYNGEPLHDRPLVKKFRDAPENAPDTFYVKGDDAMCALCGETKPVRRLHPKISGGGLRGSLISFNSEVTNSYHFDSARNFPVCNDCCNKYSIGLQRLLKTGFPDPVTCEPMPRLNLPLSEKKKVAVYWPEQEESNEGLVAPDLDLYKVFIEGNSTLLPKDPEKRFLYNYAVLSQLSSGRITVEDYYIVPLDTLVEGLRTYFDQLQLSSTLNFDFDQKFRYMPFWYKLALSAGSKAPRPSFVGDLFACAMKPTTPFPRWILIRALNRVARQKKVTPALASLIKAILIRNSILRNEKDVNMKSTLNPEHPSFAYQFGCYFALVEYVHRQAIKSKRTISTMFLKRAMTRPLSVVAQLEQKFNICVSKEPRLGWHNTRRREIWERIGTSLPLSFSLEEQGQFTAGYYFQNAEMYKSKADKALAATA